MSLPLVKRLHMPTAYLEHGYDFSFPSRAPLSDSSWFPDAKTV